MDRAASRGSDHPSRNARLAKTSDVGDPEAMCVAKASA